MITQLTATQMMERDARFRAQALSAVARAMDDEKVDRKDHIQVEDVYHVAIKAVALALKEAFDNDAELAMTRIERDHYKDTALKFTHLAPPAPLVMTKEQIEK